MSEEAARSAQQTEFDRFDQGLFDHEIEASDQRRRRRPVADWGGDDLFNHVPRRRFARTGVTAHVRRPGSAAVTSHQLRRNSDPVSSQPSRAAADQGLDFAAVVRDLAEPPLVTIYEGQDEPAGSPARRPARRRPPRTVDERLGPRPDRIAAWAFALGMLLILIAVGTADAATRVGF